MENNIREIYEKGLEKQKNANFTTGFEDLDIFCKFLSGGDIMTIGGRPAMGKTSFSVSLTNHLVDIDKKVLFFTADLSKYQLVRRLVAEKMGISAHTLAEGKIRQEELDIVLSTYENKNLTICDKQSLTIDDIELMIKAVKPEIVLVDYIQLVQMPKAPNLTEATNLAIKEIKRVAVENNVIVVLISQLSRAVEARYDKRPLLSDLRNGSLLEELSDIILFIYREGYYDCEAENPANEIIIAKNSLCPTATIMLHFKNGFFRNQKAKNTFL